MSEITETTEVTELAVDEYMRLLNLQYRLIILKLLAMNRLPPPEREGVPIDPYLFVAGTTAPPPFKCERTRPRDDVLEITHFSNVPCFALEPEDEVNCYAVALKSDGTFGFYRARHKVGACPWKLPLP